MSERDARAVWEPQVEKSSCCGDHRFSERGGTVREKPPGSAFRSGPRRGFPGPRRQRRNDVPAATFKGEGGILTHADLTWLGNWGGRACDVRANSGPRQRVTGVFRVRGCLPEASTIFQKLNRFFLLFFPRSLHSSLCFPVGCHHSLVNEKLSNFPEGHGENRWPRRKEQKQTLPLVGTHAVGKVPTPA